MESFAYLLAADPPRFEPGVFLALLFPAAIDLTEGINHYRRERGLSHFRMSITPLQFLCYFLMIAGTAQFYPPIVGRDSVASLLITVGKAIVYGAVIIPLSYFTLNQLPAYLGRRGARKPKVYDLAREAMDAGKFAEAIDLFKRSIEEEHDHVTTRQLLGKCFLELGQHRRALHELFKVVRAQPENAGARITCAVILIEKGHAMTAKGILIPDEPIPKRLRSIILQNEQARIVFGLDE